MITQYAIRNKKTKEYLCGAKGSRKYLHLETQNIVLYQSAGKAIGSIKTGRRTKRTSLADFEVVEFELVEKSTIDLELKEKELQVQNDLARAKKELADAQRIQDAELAELQRLKQKYEYSNSH